MNQLLRFATVSLCMLAVSYSSNAQDAPRVYANNHNAWFMYFGNHSFSNRWGLHAEIQLRRNDLIENPQQLLIRTGIEYQLKDGSKITAGYAFVETYPYGDFAVAGAFPEHRIWQQFTTTQTFSRFKLMHRYRLEQRFLGNPVSGDMSGGRYENRFRYMFKGSYVLTRDWKQPLFIAAYDEFFLNFGKEVAYNLFDQNRAYAAIGLTANQYLKIEVGYLYQIVQLRSLDLSATPKNKMESNHTLQAGLYFTLPFASTDDK
jgi:hypothetical protein